MSKFQQDSSSEITWQQIAKRKHVVDVRVSKVADRRGGLGARQRACAEQHGNLNASDNDKIKLNIGGVIFVARRSTLTAVPHSKLAIMFNGRWDKKLLRDKRNRFFLDVSPLCFKHILRYLLMCKDSIGDAALPPPVLPTVQTELKVVFDRMCGFFGILPDSSIPKVAVAALKGDETGDIGDTCTDLGVLLGAMERQLAQEEALFLEEQAFMEKFCGGETKDIVLLTVEGALPMAVRRSTLRLVEGSALACQFDDTAWRQGSSSSSSRGGKEGGGDASDDSNDDDDDDVDDAVWIEQPAEAFGVLVDQLRLMAITPAGETAPLPVFAAAHEREAFAAVVQYYFPGQEELFLPIPPAFDIPSAILVDQSQNLSVKQWLEEAMPQSNTTGALLSLALVYRGSRDGFRAADFHAKCDGIGGTVTVVKCTGGHVFGGYTDQSWNSTAAWVPSSRAFLFSLLNPAGVGPVKLPVTKPAQAMYCDPSRGPTFGGGNDLLIRDNCNSTAGSYSNLGTSYLLPPGQTGTTFLTGAKNFLVAEIEVFSVVQQ